MRVHRNSKKSDHDDVHFGYLGGDCVSPDAPEHGIFYSSDVEAELSLGNGEDGRRRQSAVARLLVVSSVAPC